MSSATLVIGSALPISSSAWRRQTFPHSSRKVCAPIRLQSRRLPVVTTRTMRCLATNQSENIETGEVSSTSAPTGPSTLPRTRASVGDSSLSYIKESLKGISVIDATTGKSTELTSLWAPRTVVVVWLRHFGCLLCKKRASDFSYLVDALRVEGASLVAIGPGTVEQALDLKGATRFRGEVFVDPSLASYRALSFAHGPLTVLNPVSAAKAAEARLQGFRQDWSLSLQRDVALGTAWWQGGVMVAGPNGDIHYLHKDSIAGDEPNLEEVTRAVMRATGAHARSR
eukprot:jgi/Mesvir1/29523/Mv26371-RA.1